MVEEVWNQIDTFEIWK